MDLTLAVVVITIFALVVVVAIVAIVFGQTGIAQGVLDLLPKLLSKLLLTKQQKSTEQKSPPQSESGTS